ncbi:di-trans,poly-cis-decaprenylcistransferase, partial [Candidatus Shapirobacteria bacterium]|nr:di-trans,poly-cis-decaprenylcistransferase [Candidatus Shapirobacteria bacterium]
MREKPLPLPEGTLVPNHIAFIPDGNRRWARARGLPAFEGHRRGFDLTPALAKACRSFGVHTVTVWAFSTENWDRSKEEIAFLMKKYGDFLDQHLKEAKKDKVRIFHLGRKDRIPPSLAKKLIQAEEETKSNSKYVLNVALDYGGRDDILRAIRKISEKGNMPQGLDEETFPLYLDTSAQPYPYPDLLIRTSAEQRFSGLLAWQMAYTELYWLPDHFPEITAEKIREAIIDFSRRRRRFGGNDLVPRVRFDPGKVAALEIGCLKAHNENDHKKLLDYLTGWLRELYDLKPEDALKIAKIMVAAAEYHNKRDWEKVAKTLGDAYKLLKEETGYVFTPEVAAELET